MTNEEKADLVSLTACVVLGMVVRRSATNARAQVRFGMRRFADVRAAVLEHLEGSDEPAGVTVGHGDGSRVLTADDFDAAREALGLTDSDSLSARVSEFLGGGAKRQNTIEDGLGLPVGALDGLLVEGNGFSVNAQGWVRVMEAASV